MRLRERAHDRGHNTLVSRRVYACACACFRKQAVSSRCNKFVWRATRGSAVKAHESSAPPLTGVVAKGRIVCARVRARACGRGKGLEASNFLLCRLNGICEDDPPLPLFSHSLSLYLSIYLSISICSLTLRPLTTAYLSPPLPRSHKRAHAHAPHTSTAV